jgi:hypothetical protein
VNAVTDGLIIVFKSLKSILYFSSTSFNFFVVNYSFYGVKLTTKKLKDVELKYKIDLSDLNTIIKPSVTAFTKQFRI